MLAWEQCFHKKYRERFWDRSFQGRAARRIGRPVSRQTVWPDRVLKKQRKGGKDSNEKLLSVILAFGLVPQLSACGSNSSAGNARATAWPLPRSWTPFDGVENLPESESVELTGEKWETYAFITPAEGMEGRASDALMSPVAHSVVLVRVPEGADAKEVAAEIEENANPNKWICVVAEKTIVRRHGNTILLVMSYEELADTIAGNFDKLFE